VRNAEGDVDRWYGTITDIDESRRLAEANDLIARELNHRIKNIFALIIGLVTMSARGAPEAAEFAASLAQRVRALDHAHGFVRADAAGEMVADGGLHTLLRTLFSPYDRAEGPAIEITGTDFTILRGATPLALVFHELATNAVKYGALSEEHGRVSVKTWADGENAVMEWSEFRGPVVKDRPKPTGFGSRLVEMSVKNQLGGTIVYSWQRDGLRATIRCPLEQL
jgi:two-component sensor histidine kinase